MRNTGSVASNSQATEAARKLFEFYSQSSHMKRMKTIENQSFFTTPHAMGRSVPVKTASRFQIVNKINGFVHDSYETALNFILNVGESSGLIFRLSLSRVVEMLL